MTSRRVAIAAALAAAGAPAQPEQIVMLVYPGMTALDLVGPQQVFGWLTGARVHLVGKSKEPVVSDAGLAIVPTMTFAEAPAAPDILFVPGGGRETVALMDDGAVLNFLAQRGARAGLVTSVCSGALVLGAAGLLRGYRATTHWAVHDVLPLLGATAVRARVVEDRNRITAGGVTAGIDFGLRIAARLRGEEYARALELNLEYDPQPPFGTGTPAKAGPKLTAAMTAMYQPLHDAARAAAARHRTQP
ncbi:MAG: DJ-1/PfpI family protein [Bryobacterales bacterium]|nr:DJ-1/PfpI family protein [Bryobacterales bacterium]